MTRPGISTSLSLYPPLPYGPCVWSFIASPLRDSTFFTNLFSSVFSSLACFFTRNTLKLNPQLGRLRRVEILPRRLSILLLPRTIRAPYLALNIFGQFEPMIGASPMSGLHLSTATGPVACMFTRLRGLADVLVLVHFSHDSSSTRDRRRPCHCDESIYRMPRATVQA